MGSGKHFILQILYTIHLSFTGAVALQLMVLASLLRPMSYYEAIADWKSRQQIKEGCKVESEGGLMNNNDADGLQDVSIVLHPSHFEYRYFYFQLLDHRYRCAHFRFHVSATGKLLV